VTRLRSLKGFRSTQAIDTVKYILGYCTLW